jgi:RNA polymerase sigma-70 factor (ECF subfamily)
MDRDDTDRSMERVFRDVFGQAVATLTRRFGDIDLAEDAVQDAFAVANINWRRDGIPPNPAGWIITTARRRALDRVRRRARGRELERLTAEDPTMHEPQDGVDFEADLDVPVPDDQLRMIFTCCHPALRVEHRVALTLRLVGGLTVDEIARSFLVSEATMAKRLVRAKAKIKATNIAYRIPAAHELPGRLHAVLAVIYLIYNTGADDPARSGLRTQALRLGRSIAALMPDEPEALGLLALMTLSESRMPARFVAGEIVPLRDQDRARWDRSLIDDGHAIVRTCIRRRRPGPFQLQAAIQAVHCDAASLAETDWAQIVELYDDLYAHTPTAVVAMNQAIAIAETHDARRGLEHLDPLEPDLGTYHLFHAARGEMLLRVGRTEEATQAFERAHDLASTDLDRRFLDRRISELS